GYKTVRKRLPIAINNSVSTITFSSIDDLGALTDFQAPAYAEIMYARQLNLASSELKFDILNPRTTSYLTFTNSALSNPLLIDLTTNFYFSGIKSGSNLDFVVNNAQIRKTYFVGDLDNLKPTTITPITFRAFTPNDITSFLLISNKTLTAGVNS